jgi:hypothetical protein
MGSIMQLRSSIVIATNLFSQLVEDFIQYLCCIICCRHYTIINISQNLIEPRDRVLYGAFNLKLCNRYQATIHFEFPSIIEYHVEFSRFYSLYKHINKKFFVSEIKKYIILFLSNVTISFRSF